MSKQKPAKKTAKRHQFLLNQRRLAWFAVLAFGLLVIHIGYNIRSGQPQILGYATRITTQGLLSATNTARSDNNEPALKLDPQLDKAAQAKADDMVQKNYWSHVAPDGTQPWAFFDLYNYKYLAAGENLAYGFVTSDQVISAWMNSQEHRANVLGNYQDIGFGITNGSSYQGGQNTLVVAFYGTPQPASQTLGTASLATGDLSGPSAHVNGLSVITSGGATWETYASLGLVMTVAMGFILTHFELFRSGWYKSRHYLKLHPAFDAFVIVGIALVMAYTAGGFIR